MNTTITVKRGSFPLTEISQAVLDANAAEAIRVKGLENTIARLENRISIYEEDAHRERQYDIRYLQDAVKEDFLDHEKLEALSADDSPRDSGHDNEFIQGYIPENNYELLKFLANDMTLEKNDICGEGEGYTIFKIIGWSIHERLSEAYNESFEESKDGRFGEVVTLQCERWNEHETRLTGEVQDLEVIENDLSDENKCTLKANADTLAMQERLDYAEKRAEYWNTIDERLQEF